MKSTGVIRWCPERGHLTISTNLIRALSYPAELRAVRRADGLMLGAVLPAADAVVLRVAAPDHAEGGTDEFHAQVNPEQAGQLRLDRGYEAWRDPLDDILYAVPFTAPMRPQATEDLRVVDLVIAAQDLRELEAFALRHGHRAREVIALFVATLAENARADLEEMDLTPAEREAVERSRDRMRARVAERVGGKRPPTGLVYCLVAPVTKQIRWVGAVDDETPGGLVGLSETISDKTVRAWLAEPPATRPIINILEGNVPLNRLEGRRQYWRDLLRANGAPLLNSPLESGIATRDLFD